MREGGREGVEAGARGRRDAGSLGRRGTWRRDSDSRIWQSRSATTWYALPLPGSADDGAGRGAERGAGRVPRRPARRGVARRQRAGEAVGRGAVGGVGFGLEADEGQAASRSCQRVLAMEERMDGSGSGGLVTAVHSLMLSILHPRPVGRKSVRGVITCGRNFGEGLTSVRGATSRLDLEIFCGVNPCQLLESSWLGGRAV
jgi:hypothetical protein